MARLMSGRARVPVLGREAGAEVLDGVVAPAGRASSRGRAAIATGGDPEDPLEVPGEVALVREPDLGGDLGRCEPRA